MASMADIIGSNPLAQAMAAKGIPLSALAQVSPSSANFSPQMVTPPMPTGGANPMAGTPPLQPQAPPPALPPAVPEMPVPTPAVPTAELNAEARMIIEALTERLKKITKATERPRPPRPVKNER